MKRPDEIKKGLDLCGGSGYEGSCTEVCLYHGGEPGKVCFEVLTTDALAYIRQLEIKIAEYEKPLVPLTFEEAILCDSCLETIDGEYCGMALNELAIMEDGAQSGYIVFATHGGGEAKYMAADYGRTWRCWPRMPTEKERKAVAWSENGGD